jgi:hypothetical protein
MNSAVTPLHADAGAAGARPLRAMAVIAWLSIVVVVGLSMMIYAGRGFPRLPLDYTQGLLGTSGVALTAIVYSTVGAFLATRLPRNLIGWIFLAIGLGMVVIIPANMVLAEALRTFRPLPEGGLLLVWAVTSVQLPASGALLAVVLLLIPDGRAGGRRWWAAAGISLLGCALMSGAAALQPDGLLWFPALPNPVGVGYELLGLLAMVRVLGMVLLVTGMLLAASRLIACFRTAEPAPRRQLGWVLVGALAMSATLAPLFIARYATGAPSALGEQLVFTAAVGGSLFPVAVALACIREQLFGVQAILSRTLVYVPLMAILGGTYTAAVIVMQRLFVWLTGNTSDIAFVLATLIMAGALTPVRRTLEGFAEHVVTKPSAPGRGHRPEGEVDPLLDMAALSARLASLEARLAALEPVPASPPGSGRRDDAVQGPGTAESRSPGGRRTRRRSEASAP